MIQYPIILLLHKTACLEPEIQKKAKYTDGSKVKTE